MTERQPMALKGWHTGGKGRPDPSRDRFRHNLAKLMAERGITQAGLARTMDVSRVAVHAWIWGTCFPETSRLIKLAQALNVPVGALIESESSAAPAETSNEEALLLNAFRKLPNTARLTLLADAYELSAQAMVQSAAQSAAQSAVRSATHAKPGSAGVARRTARD